MYIAGAPLNAIDDDVGSSWVAACDPCDPGEATSILQTQVTVNVRILLGILQHIAT